MNITHFYVAAISFFTGVFITTFFPLSLPTITWLIGLGVVLIVIYMKQLKTDTHFSLQLACGLCIVFFALGALRIELAQWRLSQSALDERVGEKVLLEGIVITEPDVRERVTQLTVKTGRDKVLVSVDRFREIEYGDLVAVAGTLKLPEAFETDLGRTFNYDTYLKAKGISHQIPFAEIQVLKKGEGNYIISKLLSFKQSFITQIEVYLAEPAAGLGKGLLLGVKEGLGEDLETAFRKTGIIHIVVLSGYNIMLVVIFVMAILGYFFSKKVSIFFGVMAIILFALMVGLSSTVVRASIMACLLLMTQVMNRKYLVVRGLILAALGMVLMNPYLLAYDIGFQLSFLATLGIIFITPHFARLCTRVTEVVGVRSFLVATLGTQLAVLPLLLYQIGELSLVSVLVNVLVLPMVPVAMLLTFCTGVLGYFSIVLASFVSYPAYLSLSYITKIAEIFAGLPFASILVPAFPVWMLGVLYAVMLYVLYKIYRPDMIGSIGEMHEHLIAQDKMAHEIEETLSGWVIEEEFDAPLTKATVAPKTTVA